MAHYVAFKQPSTSFYTPMPRFFTPDALSEQQVYFLPSAITQHIHVLRLRHNDKITLFNGRGGAYLALLKIDGKKMHAEILEHQSHEREMPYRIILAQGIAGGNKMDWLIEKAVELGVYAIQPLFTQKSLIRLTEERAKRRHAHWQTLVYAACEQCGRNQTPIVAPPLDFSTWLSSQKQGQLALMLTPKGQCHLNDLPSQAPEHITLLIGPEGGLSDEEQALARQKNFLSLQLGSRILRTETAAMAMLAALATRWNGW